MTKDQDEILTKLVRVFVQAYHERFAPGAPKPLHRLSRRRTK